MKEFRHKINGMLPYLSAILIAVLTGSCSKYLEVKTYDKVLPKTAEDYASIIYSHLSDIEDKTKGLFIMGNYDDASRWEFFADNLNGSLDKKPARTPYVGSYVYTAQFRFGNKYRFIRDCNIYLEYAENNDLDAHHRDVATVARTMRAISYYELIREHCEPMEPGRGEEIPGVPIVSHFDLDAKPPRSSLRASLDFVISDLQKAIQQGMTNPDLLLTTDVARFYLLRTHFWAQDWQQVIPVAKEILDAHPLIAGDAYKEMVTSTLGDLKGNALLVPYFRSDRTTMIDRALRDQKNRPISVEFAKSFTEKERDIRWGLTMDKKLQTQKPPCIRLRSAEAALCLAEAYAHLGQDKEALAILNELRSKRIQDYTPWTLQTLPPASPSGLIHVDATGKPLTPLMSAILKERRKELFNEGDRWWELKRNGRPEFWIGFNGVKYVTYKYLYTYPIWVNDLVNNPSLTQNPGYINDNL